MESPVPPPHRLRTGEKDRVPAVLCFHQFHDEGQASPERTSLPTSVFEAQMRSLLADGWRIVPLAEVIPLICQPEYTPEEPKLAITFDDAYVDVLKVAPLLTSLDLPATVFVLTDYIGKTNLWNPKAYTIRQHLSRSEMLGLASKRVDFQFHGCHHHRLTKFPPQQLEQFFFRGQDAFGEVFGREATMIAYPYGALSNDVLEAAARHFQYGLSVSQGKWSGPESRLQLNRVEVTSDMTARFLVDLLSCDRRRRREFLLEHRAAKQQRAGGA
jgi:peptidoglycan/xylan/chitin deacetylase (PgdA/CDA1 family)